MLGVFRTVPFSRPPCPTCKPGPDGVPGWGWALLVVGAGLVLFGICVLAFASRPDQGSHSASRSGSRSTAGKPTPVMDAVQREDLERRAAEESAAGQPSDASLGGALVAIGVGCGVLGLIIVTTANSRVDDDKRQLRKAAADLVSVSLDGPDTCRQSAAIVGREFPVPSASSSATPVADHCGDSPREYTYQDSITGAGQLISIKYIFSQSFSANGEVTVHDEQDDRSLCVTVPDTNVQGAAQPAPTPSTDEFGSVVTPTTNVIPFFDAVTVDPGPYITDGACPDAPVSSPGSY